MIGKTEITIEIDGGMLRRYSDEHLAALWHVAQVNPAPITDGRAGEIAEAIGREIIRRWLVNTEPALWHHQGSHHAQMALTEFARWESGKPDWNDGKWVAKSTDGAE